MMPRNHYGKKIIVAMSLSIFSPLYLNGTTSVPIDNVHQLPDELLIEIFKIRIKQTADLTDLESVLQAGRTCKLFERLLNDEEIKSEWKEMQKKHVSREELIQQLNVADKDDAQIPRNESFSLVHSAAKHNLYSLMLRELRKRPLSMYGRDYFDRTPLELAAAYGHLKIVQLLSSYGASMHPRNSKNPNPLAQAWHNKHLETIGWLLRNGAVFDPHQCNMYQILDREITVIS